MHSVRAIFDDATIRVYQAYSPAIALPAIAAGRFVPPFSMSRMTWIKPSFNWMMHRCGHASKPGQEMVLAIDIRREGFEWALQHACLSAFKPGFHASPAAWRQEMSSSPVRVQWDPERDIRLNLVHGVRAIQVGLTGEAVERYVHEWTVRIRDMTAEARQIAADLRAGIEPRVRPDQQERAYPLPTALQDRLCKE